MRAVATLTIEASASGPEVVVEASAGDRVLDLCDATRSPVEFSCRSASCGVCRVEVLDGLDGLEPARDDEREVLALFDAGPRDRLACQARFAQGAVAVRLRWVGA